MPEAAEATPTTEVPTDEVSTDSSSIETTEQTEQTTKTDETPPGAPEVYEFKNPEGLPEGIDPKIHDTFAEVARELDLPQDKAQGMFTKTLTALRERGIEELTRQSEEWSETAKADSEYGGDKLEENLGIAKKALAEFGSDGLRELLEGPTQLGNHPEIIRWMYKVGKAISEDRFVGSNSGGTVDPTDDAAKARKLYPSASKK